MSLWRWCEFAVFLITCTVLASFFVVNSSAKTDPNSGNRLKTEAKSAPSGSPEIGSEPAETEPQDFSKFKHSTPMHSRMPCLLCHKRDNNSPTMKYSGHLPCAGCHKQQFDQGNKSPLCYICHTSTSVKRFPTLKSFNARFEHSKHFRLTNCATCHKSTGRGKGYSILQRSNSHRTCFQCHSSSASNKMASCDLCHQPGRPPRAISANSPAYTATPFRHSAHIRSMNCDSCHTIFVGMGRGRQVSSPTAKMHFASGGGTSCASCHNNKRAFGGEDFSDCKRCHQGRKFKPFF
ncbi:MAG: hypothetical protein KDB79_05835 [Acidobacteria bacterium]|nr:hypothetical protein [Acidobacteriota bacterium]